MNTRTRLFGTRKGHRRPGRIWLMTQWFSPEPIPIPQNLTESLQGAGLDVEVISGYPNYPAGTLYRGYSSRWFSSENVDGVVVHRCPLYASHGKTVLGRFLNYSSWALTATLSSLKRVRRRDVVLVYSSPATAAFPAMMCRVLLGTRYVLLIQDMWPDAVLATGFLNRPSARRLARAMIEPFVRLSYSLASHIAVISPGMTDVLVERGVPRRKITLTYNWVDEDIYYPQPASSNFREANGIDDDVFLAMYAGNLGPAQALDQVVRAVGQLHDEANVVFALVGSGVSEVELRNLAEDVAPGRVLFVPPVASSEICAIMSSADIQVIALKNEPAFAHTMPSKVQSIMACGLPVIASATGDLRGVIEASGAGWVATSGDIHELEECLRLASAASKDELRRRGQLGRKFYEQTMSRAANEWRLVDLLEGVARTPIRGAW